MPPGVVSRRAGDNGDMNRSYGCGGFAASIFLAARNVFRFVLRIFSRGS